MRTVVIPARAKINLTLDVLSKRPDGFHEVEMVMQALELHDIVEVGDRGDDKEGILLTGKGADVPWDESNLAYRAAAALLQRAGHRGGVRIHVTKNIPVAAGLAGGSADAAATLKAINIWGDFGHTDNELMELGAALGSDIPFCIMEGTALATGRGEKLSPLPGIPEYWVVLAKPSIGVSTARVYQNFSLGKVSQKPDTLGIINDLKTGNRGVIPKKLANVLETVTIPWHPEIKELKEVMLKAGALGALMSGSGPTVFALADSEAKAKEIATAAGQLVNQVIITKTLSLKDS